SLSRTLLVMVPFCCFVFVVRYFFFFFQAEDGIRDFHVTGVQTCALPICRTPSHTPARSPGLSTSLQDSNGRHSFGLHVGRCIPRSEERRVGKECTSQW